MGSTGTILSIVSAALALLRWFVSYSQERDWIERGAAQALLQALQDADDAISHAEQTRQTVRDHAARDPGSVLRDDDGFQRKD